MVTGVRMAGGVISRKMANYYGKFSIKIEGLWWSHCIDGRLSKECIEINGML